MTPEEWADEIMQWGYEGEPSHVVDAIQKAIAEEREACASLAYAETATCTRHHCCGEEIAAAIRAR